LALQLKREGKSDKEILFGPFVKTGGLVSYTGTDDIRKIETVINEGQRIEQGILAENPFFIVKAQTITDLANIKEFEPALQAEAQALLAAQKFSPSVKEEDLIAVLKAKVFDLVLEAMAMQIVQELNKMIVPLKGRVDGILLTGGCAKSKIVMKYLVEYLEGLPYKVFVQPLSLEQWALLNNAWLWSQGKVQAVSYKPIHVYPTKILPDEKPSTQISSCLETDVKVFIEKNEQVIRDIVAASLRGKVDEALLEADKICLYFNYILAKAIEGIFSVPFNALQDTRVVILPVLCGYEEHCVIAFFKSSRLLFWVDPTRGQFDFRFKEKILVEGEYSLEEHGYWPLSYHLQDDASFDEKEILKEILEQKKVFYDFFKEIYTTNRYPLYFRNRVSWFVINAFINHDRAKEVLPSDIFEGCAGAIKDIIGLACNEASCPVSASPLFSATRPLSLRFQKRASSTLLEDTTVAITMLTVGQFLARWIGTKKITRKNFYLSLLFGLVCGGIGAPQVNYLFPFLQNIQSALFWTSFGFIPGIIVAILLTTALGQFLSLQGTWYARYVEGRLYPAIAQTVFKKTLVIDKMQSRNTAEALSVTSVFSLMRDCLTQIFQLSTAAYLWPGLALLVLYRYLDERKTPLLGIRSRLKTAGKSFSFDNVSSTKLSSKNINAIGTRSFGQKRLGSSPAGKSDKAKTDPEKVTCEEWVKAQEERLQAIRSVVKSIELIQQMVSTRYPDAASFWSKVDTNNIWAGPCAFVNGLCDCVPSTFKTQQMALVKFGYDILRAEKRLDVLFKQAPDEVKRQICDGSREKAQWYLPKSLARQSKAPHQGWKSGSSVLGQSDLKKWNKEFQDFIDQLFAQYKINPPTVPMPVTDGKKIFRVQWEKAYATWYAKQMRQLWDALSGVQLSPADEMLYADLLNKFFAHMGVRQGRKLLDLGTGWGYAAVAAARRGLFVQTVDVAPEMTKVAQLRAGMEKGVVPIFFRTYNFFDGLEQGDFDYVSIVGVLEWFPWWLVLHTLDALSVLNPEVTVGIMTQLEGRSDGKSTKDLVQALADRGFGMTQALTLEGKFQEERRIDTVVIAQRSGLSWLQHRESSSPTVISPAFVFEGTHLGAWRSAKLKEEFFIILEDPYVLDGIALPGTIRVCAKDACGRDAGWVFLNLKSKYVGGLFVKEDYRGNRFAVKILKALFKVAAQRGLATLWWEIEEENKHSRKAFERATRTAPYKITPRGKMLFVAALKQPSADKASVSSPAGNKASSLLANKIPFSHMLEKYLKKSGPKTFRGADGFVAFLRNGWGVDNKEVARETGMSKSAVSDYINSDPAKEITPEIGFRLIHRFLRSSPSLENRLWRISRGDASLTQKGITTKWEQRIKEISAKGIVASEMFRSGIFNDLCLWSGFPNKKVAEGIGVQVSLISKWRQGVAFQDHAFADKIAKFFASTNKSFQRQLQFLLLGIAQYETFEQLLARVKDPRDDLSAGDLVYIARIVAGYSTYDVSCGNGYIWDSTIARAEKRGFSPKYAVHLAAIVPFKDPANNKELARILVRENEAVYNPAILRRVDTSEIGYRAGLIALRENINGMSQSEFCKLLKCSRSIYTHFEFSGGKESLQAVTPEKFMAAARIPWWHEWLYRKHYWMKDPYPALTAFMAEQFELFVFERFVDTMKIRAEIGRIVGEENPILHDLWESRIKRNSANGAQVLLSVGFGNGQPALIYYHGERYAEIKAEANVLDMLDMAGQKLSSEFFITMLVTMATKDLVILYPKTLNSFYHEANSAELLYGLGFKDISMHSFGVAKYLNDKHPGALVISSRELIQAVDVYAKKRGSQEDNQPQQSISSPAGEFLPIEKEKAFIKELIPYADITLVNFVEKYTGIIEKERSQTLGEDENAEIKKFRALIPVLLRKRYSADCMLVADEAYHLLKQSGFTVRLYDVISYDLEGQSCFNGACVLTLGGVEFIISLMSRLFEKVLNSENRALFWGAVLVPVRITLDYGDRFYFHFLAEDYLRLMYSPDSILDHGAKFGNSSSPAAGRGILKEYAHYSDDEVIKNFYQGDNRAFDVIFFRYWGLGKAYILKYASLRNGEGEEVLSDVFLKIWKTKGKKTQFDGACRFSFWFYKILANECINALKRKKRMNAVYVSGDYRMESGLEGETTEGKMVADEDTLWQREMELFLKSTASELSPCRNVDMALRYSQQLTCAEIASMRGVKPVTVRASLCRARKSLKRLSDTIALAYSLSEEIRIDVAHLEENIKSFKFKIESNTARAVGQKNSRDLRVSVRELIDKIERFVAPNQLLSATLTRGGKAEPYNLINKLKAIEIFFFFFSLPDHEPSLDAVDHCLSICENIDRVLNALSNLRHGKIVKSYSFSGRKKFGYIDLFASIPPASSLGSSKSCSPVGKTKTILLVDDSLELVEQFKQMLEQEGYFVLRALDGKNAINFYFDQLKNKKIDLVVTDLAMPGMNGLALTAQLREKKITLPVLLQSGGFDLDKWEEERAYYQSFGATDILVKNPYSKKEFLDKVKELLCQQKQVSSSVAFRSFCSSSSAQIYKYSFPDETFFRVTYYPAQSDFFKPGRFYYAKQIYKEKKITRKIEKKISVKGLREGVTIVEQYYSGYRLGSAWEVFVVEGNIINQKNQEFYNATGKHFSKKKRTHSLKDYKAALLKDAEDFFASRKILTLEELDAGLAPTEPIEAVAVVEAAVKPAKTFEPVAIVEAQKPLAEPVAPEVSDQQAQAPPAQEELPVPQPEPLPVVPQTKPKKKYYPSKNIKIAKENLDPKYKNDLGPAIEEFIKQGGRVLKGAQGFIVFLLTQHWNMNYYRLSRILNVSATTVQAWAENKNATSENPARDPLDADKVEAIIDRFDLGDLHQMALWRIARGDIENNVVQIVENSRCAIAAKSFKEVPEAGLRPLEFVDPKEEFSNIYTALYLASGFPDAKITSDLDLDDSNTSLTWRQSQSLRKSKTGPKKKEKPGAGKSQEKKKIFVKDYSVVLKIARLFVPNIGAKDLEKASPEFFTFLFGLKNIQNAEDAAVKLQELQRDLKHVLFGIAKYQTADELFERAQDPKDALEAHHIIWIIRHQLGKSRPEFIDHLFGHDLNKEFLAEFKFSHDTIEHLEKGGLVSSEKKELIEAIANVLGFENENFKKDFIQRLMVKYVHTFRPQVMEDIDVYNRTSRQRGLESFRHDNGDLSRDDVAAALGVSLAVYRDFEISGGEKNGALIDLAKLMDVLGISRAFLKYRKRFTEIYFTGAHLKDDNTFKEIKSVSLIEQAVKCFFKEDTSLRERWLKIIKNVSAKHPLVKLLLVKKGDGIVALALSHREKYRITEAGELAYSYGAKYTFKAVCVLHMLSARKDYNNEKMVKDILAELLQKNTKEGLEPIIVLNVPNFMNYQLAGNEALRILRGLGFVPTWKGETDRDREFGLHGFSSYYLPKEKGEKFFAQGASSGVSSPVGNKTLRSTPGAVDGVNELTEEMIAPLREGIANYGYHVDSRVYEPYFDQRILPDLQFVFNNIVPKNRFSEFYSYFKECAQDADFRAFDWVAYRLVELSELGVKIDFSDMEALLSDICSAQPLDWVNLDCYLPENYPNWVSGRSLPLMFQLELLDLDLKGKRALEIGAGGDPCMIKWLRGKGAQVTLADISWRAVRIARQDYRGQFDIAVRRADIMKEGALGQSRYDIIIASSVFYYAMCLNGKGPWSFEQSRQLIYNLKSALKEGGLVAASFFAGNGKDHRMPSDIEGLWLEAGFESLPNATDGVVKIFRLVQVQHLPVPADNILRARMKKFREKVSSSPLALSKAEEPRTAPIKVFTIEDMKSLLAQYSEEDLKILLGQVRHVQLTLGCGLCSFCGGRTGKVTAMWSAEAIAYLLVNYYEYLPRDLLFYGYSEPFHHPAYEQIINLFGKLKNTYVSTFMAFPRGQEEHIIRFLNRHTINLSITDQIKPGAGLEETLGRLIVRQNSVHFIWAKQCIQAFHQGKLFDVGPIDEFVLPSSKIAWVRESVQASSLVVRSSRRLTVAQAKELLKENYIALIAAYENWEKELAVLINDGVDEVSDEEYQAVFYPRLVQITTPLREQWEKTHSVVAFCGITDLNLQKRLDEFLGYLSERVNVDKISLCFYPRREIYSYGFSDKELRVMETYGKDIGQILDKNKNDEAGLLSRLGVMAGIYGYFDKRTDEYQDNCIQIYLFRSPKFVERYGLLTNADRTTVKKAVDDFFLLDKALWNDAVLSLRRDWFEFNDFISMARHNGGLEPIRLGIINKLFYEKGRDLRKFLFNKKIKNDIKTIIGLLETGFDLKRRPIKAKLVEIVDRYRDALSEKGLTLIKEIEAEEQVVRICDDHLFQIMVDNLMENAIKYTFRGGTVWVRLYKKDQDVVLEVEDTGVGIAKNEIDKVFDEGFRGSHVGDSETKGGFGLSIVRGIARTFRGEIHVVSQLGKGSKFVICMELAKLSQENSFGAAFIIEANQKDIISGASGKNSEEICSSPVEVGAKVFVLKVDLAFCKEYEKIIGEFQEFWGSPQKGHREEYAKLKKDRDAFFTSLGERIGPSPRVLPDGYGNAKTDVGTGFGVRKVLKNEEKLCIGSKGHRFCISYIAKGKKRSGKEVLIHRHHAWWDIGFLRIRGLRDVQVVLSPVSIMNWLSAESIKEQLGFAVKTVSIFDRNPAEILDAFSSREGVALSLSDESFAAIKWEDLRTGNLNLQKVIDDQRGLTSAMSYPASSPIETRKEEIKFVRIQRGYGIEELKSAFGLWRLWRQARLAKEKDAKLEDIDLIWVAAVLEKRVVGLIKLLVPRDEGDVFIKQLKVVRSYRNKGIGKRLVVEAMRLMDEYNLQGIQGCPVDERAVGLNKSLGFDFVDDGFMRLERVKGKEWLDRLLVQKEPLMLFASTFSSAVAFSYSSSSLGVSSAMSSLAASSALTSLGNASSGSSVITAPGSSSTGSSVLGSSSASSSTGLLASGSSSASSSLAGASSAVISSSGSSTITTLGSSLTGSSSLGSSAMSSPMGSSSLGSSSLLDASPAMSSSQGSSTLTDQGSSSAGSSSLGFLGTSSAGSSFLGSSSLASASSLMSSSSSLGPSVMSSPRGSLLGGSLARGSLGDSFFRNPSFSQGTEVGLYNSSALGSPLKGLGAESQALLLAGTFAWRRSTDEINDADSDNHSNNHCRDEMFIQKEELSKKDRRILAMALKLRDSRKDILFERPASKNPFLSQRAQVLSHHFTNVDYLEKISHQRNNISTLTKQARNIASRPFPVIKVRKNNSEIVKIAHKRQREKRLRAIYASKARENLESYLLDRENGLEQPREQILKNKLAKNIHDLNFLDSGNVQEVISLRQKQKHSFRKGKRKPKGLSFVSEDNTFCERIFNLYAETPRRRFRPYFKLICYVKKFSYFAGAVARVKAFIHPWRIDDCPFCEFAL